MDPLTIASIGASLIGAISGNSQQKKQNKLIQDQMAQQQALSERQLALAEQMNQQGLATQIDANGNITYYDPATNTWRSVLSPDQQALQDLSDANLKQVLSIDAPMGRAESLVNAVRRSKEGSTADGIMSGIQDQLKGTTAVRGSDLASSLRLSRQNAVNNGFDQVSNALTTQALRSGATGGTALLGALGKQRAQALAATMGNPDLEGMQLADDINNSRINTSFNLYNALAGRASGAPIQAFNPVSTANTASSSLANARSAAQQGAAAQGSLTNSASSILGNMKLPDYTQGGQAALWNSISNLLGSGAFGTSTSSSKDKNTSVWKETDPMGANS